MCVGLRRVDRMDGTPVASSEIAVQQAQTATAFKRPSKTLEDAGGRNVVMRLPAALPGGK